jgi:transcription elongation factor Elf1
VPPATSAAIRERHEQQRQQERKAAAAAPTTLRRLGCQACGFVSALRVDGTEAEIACKMCGHRAELAAADELGRRLDLAEQVMWQSLVEGGSEHAAAERMAAVGMAPQQASTMVQRRAIDLPLVRFRILKRLRAGERDLELGCPATCDLCPAALPGVIRPHVIAWSRLDSEEVSLSPWTAVSLFAGVALYEKESSSTVMTGVYFACDGCVRALRSRVFGTYRGYPANQGFRVTSMQRLG